MAADVWVVARRAETSRSLARQILPFLADRVRVREAPLASVGSIRSAGLVVVSTTSLVQRVARMTNGTAPIVVARRTLTKDGWQKIVSLPMGTAAMVVNDAEDTALETIALLHQLGVRQLDLTPVWPERRDIPPLTLAITPGEADLVPAGVETVIDVGERVVTPGVIIEILVALRLYDEVANDRIHAHTERVVPYDAGLHAVLDKLSEAKQQLERLLNQVEEAVIAFDRLGRIQFTNRHAERFLSMPAYQLVGQTLEEVLGHSGLTEEIRSLRLPMERLEMLHGRSLMIRTAAVDRRGEVIGGMVTMRDVTEVRKLERKLYHKVASEGHVARYTFRDILGDSAAIRNTVARAQRLAHSDAAVMLTGETGTGKELFAQAIHNASSRRPFPFVAINCASFPPSLLESELFGYEEGAFTGARKGGKEGLFELAHLGTLFLDEVVDMSPEVQSRLLRVLQEGEVARVGGTRVRRVDVRVIAATNRSLEALVDQGSFRADLYHRLNVLPLALPPLRARPEDIPALVHHFLRQAGDTRSVPPDIMAVLQGHAWPGNVRDLKNCLDYMRAVSDGPFTRTSLPARVVMGGHVAATGPDRLSPAQRYLLDIVGRATSGGRGIGRRRLAREALRDGAPLSEGEVRRLLGELQALGLVEVRPGRAGTKITPRGRVSAGLPG